MSWRVVSFGELADESKIDIQTGPFGTQLKASDYTSNGIPVINVRNIGYGNLILQKLEYVSESTAERLKKHLLQTGDIVFGRKGAVDRHLLVKSNQNGWMQGSDCIRLRMCSNSFNPRFISYLLLQEEHKRWMITQCSNKATMASLNQDVIKRISFKLPKISLQDKIANILSAYDDLIENNQRRVALLEQVARLLYKEWFVYFRFPGHEFVKITDNKPEGWERGNVGNLAKVKSGYAFKSKDWQTNGHPVIKIKNIVGDGTVDILNCDCVSDNVAEKSERFTIKRGDILIAMTGATVGKVGIMHSSPSKYYLNQRVGVFESNHESQIELFLYPFFMEDNAQNQIINLAAGAAQPNISAKQIESIELIVPELSILSMYINFVKPYFELRQNLIKQNEKLKITRDLLLPCLMNGEISV